MLGDLQSPGLIHLKGALFLLIGILAGTCLLIQMKSWLEAGLLLATIWGFCRFYYYAFYVIEKYTDPTFKYAGLSSFVMYWFSKK